jgi:hypothetical protein
MPPDHGAFGAKKVADIGPHYSAFLLIAVVEALPPLPIRSPLFAYPSPLLSGVQELPFMPLSHPFFFDFISITVLPA